MSRWDPAQTGSATPLGLNRLRQAALSGSASLFSIIPLEVVADEEVMACDGEAGLMRNDVITIEPGRLITSLMIFNKSSKDWRAKEKLPFDRREVFSHSHRIAVGHPASLLGTSVLHQLPGRKENGDKSNKKKPGRRRKLKKNIK